MYESKVLVKNMQKLSPFKDYLFSILVKFDTIFHFIVITVLCYFNKTSSFEITLYLHSNLRALFFKNMFLSVSYYINTLNLNYWCFLTH